MWLLLQRNSQILQLQSLVSFNPILLCLVLQMLDRGSGAGYTPVEDWMVRKPFIVASEDSVCGTLQKGTLFKNTMHDSYLLLLLEQEEKNKMDYSKVSSNAGIAPK